MNRKSQKRERVKVSVLPSDDVTNRWIKNMAMVQAPTGKILSLNGLNQARVRFKREGVYKSGGNYWFEVYLEGFGFQAFEYDRQSFDWQLKMYNFMELPHNKSDIEHLKKLYKNGLINDHIVLSEDYQSYLYCKQLTQSTMFYMRRD